MNEKTSEPTLRDLLDAVHGLAARMDRLESRMDGLERQVGSLSVMVEETRDMVSNLSVQTVRRTGTGDD